MNYIREINAFEKRMKRAPLPTTAQLLWYKLMAFANWKHWPDSFFIDNETLASLLNAGSDQTARTARAQLVEAGLLIYEKGAKARPGTYKLISIAEQEYPSAYERDGPDGDTPPEDDFLAEVKSDITTYFGYTEALGAELRQTVSKLFDEFCPGRQPSEADLQEAFFAIKEQHQDEEGQWVMTFPVEQKELLAYAFKQASLNDAMTWNYINGVLRNLHGRGVKNVQQAYEQEAERDRRKGRW